MAGASGFSVFRKLVAFAFVLQQPKQHILHEKPKSIKQLPGSKCIHYVSPALAQDKRQSSSKLRKLQIEFWKEEQIAKNTYTHTCHGIRETPTDVHMNSCSGWGSNFKVFHLTLALCRYFNQHSHVLCSMSLFIWGSFCSRPKCYTTTKGFTVCNLRTTCTPRILTTNNLCHFSVCLGQISTLTWTIHVK